MGLKERGGYIRAEVIPNASTDALADVVRRNVKRGSIVSTDEWKGYNLLKYRGFQHATVNHSEKQYAVTDDLGNRVACLPLPDYDFARRLHSPSDRRNS
jgi:transposase-like protein